MIDKRHLFQNLDTGNLVNEIQSQLFKRAPTAKVIQEPKPLTSTEEVDLHVSDLQHMIGAYSVVNTPENFHGGKIQYILEN